MYRKCLEDAGKAETHGGIKNLIVDTSDGKSFVYGDRAITLGDNPGEWSSTIEEYINNNILHGKVVELLTVDGDTLTLTPDETAWKSGSRNEVRGRQGNRRISTDEEYATKIKAEAHIDEVSTISKRGKQIVKDNKKPSVCKKWF